MSSITSRGGTERETAAGRGRRGGVRLLLASAGLGVLATVAVADGATAGTCPTGAPSWMACQAPAPSTSPWGAPTSSLSWWSAPATRPPVTSPPATVPPVTVPPVTVPAAIPAPVPVVSPPLPAVPQPVPEAARRLLELVNLERQRAGLGPLRTRDDVAAIALAHSHRMARAGDIFHNWSYFSRATRKQLRSVVRGENVAYNGSVENAHARLMRSPGHRANLLDRHFSVVGIAVVQAPDGRYFITQDFLQPARPPRRATRRS